MAFAPQLDFHRPPSQLSVDRKPGSLLDDLDSLDDSILDANSISPVAMHRRDSFAPSNPPIFSPQNALLEDFSINAFDHAPHVSTNPFEVNNNPFTRLPPAQAATYGQQPSAWTMFDRTSGSATPVHPHSLESFGQEFDSVPPGSFVHPVPHAPTSFSGLPVSNEVRPGSVFPPAQPTPLPPSPHSNQEWMALAQHELDSRPLPKRMRPNTPPRSFSPFQRRDGIRKKNARFEIPAERSLLNIDHLIAQSNNEEEIKELKQQKRLLRNRQAALDSRQRKKKHTEELEEEKKVWTERLAYLEDECASLRLQTEAYIHEKEQLRREVVQCGQVIEQLNWEKEELVRSHTLETGELRKKVSLLTEKLEATSTAMSAAPSTSGFTDFAADMDNLTMGPSDWDYISFNDFCMDPEATSPQQSQQPQQRPIETSLVISPKKRDTTVTSSDQDKPVTSGLLLMLLLCGAFVASRSSGGAPPAIPRMPDDVRAASATVLDSLFKDAGVAPSPSATLPRGLIVNHMDALEPAPSSSLWPKATLSGAEFASLSNSRGTSTLDRLHTNLVSPTKDQEAEQLFSMTPSQYNSLTSTDFTRRVYSVASSDDIESLSPGSQPPSHRRNLAETLAAMREESKGETAAEVYTRSLLWDRIPSEVVREFKRMVEETNGVASSGGAEGLKHEV